jgi:hypothetical protein
MKIIFTSVTLVLLFSSCRKDDMAASLKDPTESNKVYVSNWEGAASTAWQSSHDSAGIATYSYQKPLPQVNNGVMSDGIVAVYTKGYSFNEFSVSRPMNLPFLFYTNDQQTVPFAWEMEKRQGRVDVLVKMPATQENQFVQGQTGIQFRYIVVPREFLIKHDLSASAFSKLTYEDLSKLLEFTM